MKAHGSYDVEFEIPNINASNNDAIDLSIDSFPTNPPSAPPPICRLM